MNIVIKTTNYELTTEAQELIEKKFGLLERLLHEGESALLEAEVENMPEGQFDGARYRVEVNLTVNGKLYRATIRSGSLEGGVEKVRHELEQEIRRAYGRTRRFLKRGGSILKNALRGWS